MSGPVPLQTVIGTDGHYVIEPLANSIMYPAVVEVSFLFLHVSGKAFAEEACGCMCILLYIVSSAIPSFLYRSGLPFLIQTLHSTAVRRIVHTGPYSFVHACCFWLKDLGVDRIPGAQNRIFF